MILTLRNGIDDLQNERREGSFNVVDRGGWEH